MTAALTLLIGLAIGFLSGLFGVGGSSVATPLLRLLGVARLEALASPLPATFLTAFVGGLSYWRRGLVRRRVVGWTVVGGIPAVLVGADLSGEVPGRLLMALTAAFILYAGVRVLRPSPADTAPAAPRPERRGLLLLLGALVGGLSGLLGNGGGTLLVPAYLIVCRMTPQEAAASSLVAVALLALPGTIIHWGLGHIDGGLALRLALGVLPASYLGARVGMALPVKPARRLFGLFLLLFGLFFLARTLYRVELYGWR